MFLVRIQSREWIHQVNQQRKNILDRQVWKNQIGFGH